MADAIVTALMKQLISVAFEEGRQQVKLVAGVQKEVSKLESNLLAIQTVLDNAEQRQVKEKTVGLWLDRLKYAAYDMEDVLDEWNTARLKLQIEGVGDDDDESAVVPRDQKKKKCRKLKTLPDQLLQKTPLQNLEVFDCPVRKLLKDRAKISHIPKVRIS